MYDFCLKIFLLKLANSNGRPGMIPFRACKTLHCPRFHPQVILSSQLENWQEDVALNLWDRIIIKWQAEKGIQKPKKKLSPKGKKKRFHQECSIKGNWALRMWVKFWLGKTVGWANVKFLTLALHQRIFPDIDRISSVSSPMTIFQRQTEHFERKLIG